MIDYTKAAFGKIISDVKKIGLFFTISSQLFMIAYLTYAVITNESLRIVNGILLALAVCYFFFYLQIRKDGFTKEEIQLKKRIDKPYTIIKRIAKLYTLGVAVFGLYCSAKNVNPISIILTTLTILAFLFQIIIDILLFVVEQYKILVMTAIETDFDNLTKPFRAVGNFAKKITGKEVEPEKEPTKERLLLDKLVEVNREEKKQIKVAKKQARKDKLAEKRLDRQRLKAEKAAEKEREKEAAASIATTQDVLSESAISKDEKPKKRNK